MLRNKPEQADVRGRIWPVWGSLVLVLEGEGIFAQDGITESLSPGDLVATFPGFEHSYYRTSQSPWSEYHIIVQKDTWDDLVSSGLVERQHPVLHLGLCTPAVAAMHEMVSAFLRNASMPPQTALAGITRILTAASPARQRKAVSSFARLACRLLAENLQHPCNQTAIARHLGLGSDRFRKRFTQELGMTPYRYRQWCLVQEAQRLLNETNQPIKAIARQLGFCSPNHLTRRFRQLTGVTPALWRKRGTLFDPGEFLSSDP